MPLLAHRCELGRAVLLTENSIEIQITFYNSYRHILNGLQLPTLKFCKKNERHRQHFTKTACGNVDQFYQRYDFFSSFSLKNNVNNP